MSAMAQSRVDFINMFSCIIRKKILINWQYSITSYIACCMFPTLALCRPWDKDRYMTPDIEAATKLLREGKIWAAVEPYINHYKAASNEPPPK